MRAFTFTSYLSVNFDGLLSELMQQIAEKFDISAKLIKANDYGSFENFKKGEINFAFICVYPYVKYLLDIAEPLVSFVFKGKRYKDKPIYYADMIVNSQRSYESFADLRASRFAYNDSNSLSGYASIRKELKSFGLDFLFFSKLIQTDSHLASIDSVLKEKADVAAIDSQVLEVQQKNIPELTSKIRTLKALGPFPTPILIGSNNFDTKVREAIKDAFLNLPRTSNVRKILSSGGIKKFVPVSEESLEAIKELLYGK